MWNVGVIPAGVSLLVHTEGRAPGLSLRNQLMRPTILLRRNVQAVPVHGGVFVHGIVDVDDNIFAATQTQGWAKVVAIDPYGRGVHAGKKPGSAVLHLQGEFTHWSGLITTERPFKQLRNSQRIDAHWARGNADFLELHRSGTRVCSIHWH